MSLRDMRGGAWLGNLINARDSINDDLPEGLGLLELRSELIAARAARVEAEGAHAARSCSDCWASEHRGYRGQELTRFADAVYGCGYTTSCFECASSRQRSHRLARSDLLFSFPLGMTTLFFFPLLKTLTTFIPVFARLFVTCGQVLRVSDLQLWAGVEGE